MLLNSMSAAGKTLGGAWEEGVFRFTPLGPRAFQGLPSAAGPVSPRAPCNQGGLGRGWEGAWTGRGRNVFLRGGGPGGNSYPPAPTMAAAAVGQVGLRPRVGGLGNAEGRRTSGRTTRPQPVRRGAASLALGFRCEAPRKTGGGVGWGREGGLGKEHRALVGGGRQVISGKETGTEGLRRETWRR